MIFYKHAIIVPKIKKVQNVGKKMNEIDLDGNAIHVGKF